jgi:hypothetical protein
MDSYDQIIQVNNHMLIEEIVGEYGLTRDYNPMVDIRRGDRIKKQLTPVQTPLVDFDVRYDKSRRYHDYYMYSKTSGKCVGLFSIEDSGDELPKIIKPGVRAVTPHMSLAPAVQRQGISTLAYTTFLRGGNWVFTTDHHTQGAARLWDSIATGDIISLYVDGETGKPIKHPGYTSIRVMGPRDRFRQTSV